MDQEGNHQCEGKTAAGSQCRRNKTTITNGKWLCKQHGGKGVMPSCQRCGKARGEWPDLEFRNMCRTCGVMVRIQMLANTMHIPSAPVPRPQAPRPQPQAQERVRIPTQIEECNEDPINYM